MRGLSAGSFAFGVLAGREAGLLAVDAGRIPLALRESWQAGKP